MREGRRFDGLRVGRTLSCGFGVRAAARGEMWTMMEPLDYRSAVREGAGRRRGVRRPWTVVIAAALFVVVLVLLPKVVGRSGSSGPVLPEGGTTSPSTREVGGR